MPRADIAPDAPRPGSGVGPVIAPGHPTAMPRAARTAADSIAPDDPRATPSRRTHRNSGRRSRPSWTSAREPTRPARDPTPSGSPTPTWACSSSRSATWPRHARCRWCARRRRGLASSCATASCASARLGSDWPRYGLTMVGLARLDDLQQCVRTVVADGVPGDLIEAGAWRGGASMFMRADARHAGRRAHASCVADSFSGFRDDLRVRGPGRGGLPGRPARGGAGQLRPLRPRNRASSSCAGYFEDTMAGLGGRPWAHLPSRRRQLRGHPRLPRDRSTRALARAAT